MLEVFQRGWKRTGQTSVFTPSHSFLLNLWESHSNNTKLLFTIIQPIGIVAHAISLWFCGATFVEIKGVSF